MKNKRIVALVLAMITILTSFVACSKSEPASKEEKQTTAVSQKAEEGASTVAANSTTVANGSTSATSTTAANSSTSATSTTKADGKSTTKKVSTTAKKEKVITLQKNGKAKSNAGKAVALKSGMVTITAAGDYVIKSDTNDWHGQIIVKLPNTAKASLRFENVNITYNKGNIIQIIDSSIKSKRNFLEAEASNTDANDDAIKEVADNDKAPNVDLSFPTGTKSTFTSSSNNFTGIIYNESKLTIKGNGALNIKSIRNTENCLCSTKSVTFKNVTTNMTTANNNVTEKISTAAGSAKGIFCYNKVTVESGKLNITTNGDAIRCDKLYVKGGTTIATSSACDAIDADDVIDITGGRIEAYATQKSAFKVRRVNAEETRKLPNGAPKDYFKIAKSTVIGEGKKMTAPTRAVQPTVVTKIKKKAGSLPTSNAEAIAQDDENRMQKITLQLGNTKKTSKTLCTKMLYSTPAVKKGNSTYKAKSTYGTFESQAWAGGVCTIKIRSTK